MVMFAEGWLDEMASRSDSVEGAGLLRRHSVRHGSSRGDEPLENELVRLTIDFRRVTQENTIDMSAMDWPHDVGRESLWNVPLLQICFRMSSTSPWAYVKEGLDDMEKNLADEPSGTGFDKAGLTFREQIRLDDDGPE
jgi:hypothetical protein